MMKPENGNRNKRILTIAVILIAAALIAGLFALSSKVPAGRGSGSGDEASSSGGSTAVRLERDDWSDDVKTAVNDLLDTCGSQDSKGISDRYAVFDFDNTCSIFDIEEHTVVYQIQTMAFKIKPEQINDILMTGIPDEQAVLTDHGYFNGSLRDLAADISDAYSVLWDSYGPFTADGVDAETAAKMQEDPYWLEFAAKLWAMYDATDGICSHDVSYPWLTYLFTGMTEEEIYDMTTRALEEYTPKETSGVTWMSPSEISSRTGVVSSSWTSGVTVSENVKELWKALDSNGIDVWVCSASVTGVIKAAIDHYGLHESCTGMLGMTDMTDADGCYINSYDYENGCGYYAVPEGWVKMDRPTRTQTQAEGKVIAIVNAIAPEYGGRGPTAGFMDSTGDFNFCTEFDSLKLVICFNRANRMVTEGGGLIAEVAMYEKDTLGYDLKKASDAGDTLYLLQGRDETGLRSLRNSNATIKYEDGEEKLFRSEENEEQLQAMIDGKMSVADTLNKYAIKTPAGENGLDFDTGFLDEYSGYHSVKDPE